MAEEFVQSIANWFKEHPYESLGITLVVSLLISVSVLALSRR